MFAYSFGTWTLEFSKEYRIVQDSKTAVVLDDDRTALVLISLNDKGNICIERTYYAMICEIDAAAHKISFHVTDDIA